MNDIEQLKMIDLEDRLRFTKEKNVELKKEVQRLQDLLNGKDMIKNSLPESESPFNHLKSSFRHKNT